MRIAVIGGGVSGLGAAYVLSRSGHEVHVRARREARRPRQHGRPRRARARHGIHRLERAQLPVAHAALRRARRDLPALGDVVLGELRRVRARVRGPQAVRPVAECDEHGVHVAHVGGRTLAAHGAPVDRRRSVRPLLARRLPRAPPLLARVPAALHRAAHVGAVVGGTRPHARDPGRVCDPLLRQPRDAGTSASSLENRHGWCAHLRAGYAIPPVVEVNLPVRGCVATATECSCARTTTSCATSIGAVVATHADEALALLEDPSDDERAVLGAFGHAQNDAVLHTDSSPLAPAPHTPPGTTASTAPSGRP